MATGPPDCQDQIVTKRRVLATFCNFWHRSLCNHTALINLGNTARSALSRQAVERCWGKGSEVIVSCAACLWPGRGRAFVRCTTPRLCLPGGARRAITVREENPPKCKLVHCAFSKHYPPENYVIGGIIG